VAIRNATKTLTYFFDHYKGIYQHVKQLAVCFVLVQKEGETKWVFSLIIIIIIVVCLSVFLNMLIFLFQIF